MIFNTKYFKLINNLQNLTKRTIKPRIDVAQNPKGNMLN